VPELALHGVVAFLSAFVGFLRTFSAVGIIVEMIALAFHVRPFEIVNKL
jgi:gamma-glutamyl:cysteine ligase YbdK (ATP-grasp superfamily)